MAGWLSRATSLFQQTPPPPEPFEVECDCGGKVTGQRSSTYQRPACGICERPVFVLPVNVYPATKPKSTPKKSGKKPAADASTSLAPKMRTVVQDDEADAEPGSSKRRSRPKTSDERVGQSQAVAESLLVSEPREPLMTPLRMVTAAIVIISALTVGGLWNRQRIETAKVTALQAADAGKAAIQENDFVKASQELERARNAVDLLGKTDRSANEIRRLSREVNALVKLESNSLTDFLTETLSNAKKDSPDPLPLSPLDQGSWVIFDTRVLPGTSGANHCVIDAPMLLPQATVRIEIESPVLAKLPRSNDSGDVPRAVFAAQIERLSAPAGDPLTAVLLLNGKTAFLWTTYETLVAAGFRAADSETEQQTRSLLEQQLEMRQ